MSRPRSFVPWQTSTNMSMAGLSLADLRPCRSPTIMSEPTAPPESSFRRPKGAAMRFLLLLILVSGAIGTKAIAAPVVHTRNGDVLGVVQGSVESFKAVPFAAPPVGDLRWKA